MFGLKRKRKEEEEQDEDEKQSKKDSPKKRTRKPKEKEKPKPWGKRERYLVFGILFATVLASAVLAMAARSWKLPNAPRITLPENAFEDTFILGGETGEEKMSTQENFEKAVKSLSGVYGFFVMELTTNKKYGSFEGESFQAASLIKLPVMALMYEEAEKKRLNLDSKHSLTEDEKVGGSGSLVYEPAGTTLTLRQLIEKMGQQSDNTAFNIAVNMLGEGNIESYISEIGMRDTSLSTNETTPKDIGIFFEKLMKGRLVSEHDRDELLGYLTDTIYEEHLPKGVPEGISVAHKFGREIHIVNDAGVVFADRPYIAVIMTKGIIEKEADLVFPELSRIIFEGIN